MRLHACAYVCACVRACFGPAHGWTELPKTLSGAHYLSREEEGGLLGGAVEEGGEAGHFQHPSDFLRRSKLRFLMVLNGFESNSATYSDAPCLVSVTECLVNFTECHSVSLSVL